MCSSGNTISNLAANNVVVSTTEQTREKEREVGLSGSRLFLLYMWQHFVCSLFHCVQGAFSIFCVRDYLGEFQLFAH